MADSGGSGSDASKAVGERRQATVLFADMAGFTAISERLGEEGTFGLMRSVSELLAGAIREHGGSVKDFTGDGIMALFGVPLAQEDATLRACRAALAIQNRLQAAQDRLAAEHGVRPAMRIGINTGPVVVGDVQGSTTALGDTVNVASRLQALAAPGTVLLSDAAWRGVEGLVEAAPAGDHEVKGKTERQKVWRLDFVREGAARFERALSRGLTEYVGRQSELAVLDRHLEGIAATHHPDPFRPSARPCMVDVVGDPGIGKSRLLHEFRRRVSPEHGTVFVGNCLPDGRQTPYLPFLQIIRSVLGLAPGDPPAEIARKLEEGLSNRGLASAENGGLLLNLFGLKVPEGVLTGLDATVIGIRSRELLADLLTNRLSRRPLILLLEDLHWMDSASEQLVERIMLPDRSSSGLLIISTRRPEYSPPWAASERTTTLQMAPLSEDETSRIVRARLGAKDLPPGLARLMSDKAEGNALFAEELANFLLERGIVRASGGGLDYDPSGLSRLLPGSVKTLLAARVDHLAAADRELLQAASVIGRSFSGELLAVIKPISGQKERLEAMEGLELIRRDAGSGEWIFKHALVQDVLYDALLSGPREAMHRAIAVEIERRSGNRLEEVAEALAHHYRLGGDVDKAFTYLAMAGMKSFGVYSLDEAEEHFEKALTILEARPACTDDAGVADLLAGFTSLCSVQMHPSRLLEVVDRHRERLYSAGDLPQVVIVLGNLVYGEMVGSRWHLMSEHAEQALAIAERLGDDRSKACARASWILCKCLLGQSSLAEADSQIQLALAESQRVDDSFLHYLVLWASAWDRFQRGLTDEGRAYSRELQARGRRLGDPRSEAAGLGNLAWFDLVDERYDDMLANASASLEIAIARADVGLAELLKGMALVFKGRIEEGAAALWAVRTRCIGDGWTYITSASDVPLGVTMVLQGDIAGGIRFIEAIIERNSQLGFVVGRDMARLYLTEVYLELLAPAKPPPVSVIVKNFRFLVVAKLKGWQTAMTMMQAARENPMFSGSSHWRARVEANLGFLHILKKQYAEARACLTRARPIAERLNSTALLAKVDAALARLPKPSA